MTDHPTYSIVIPVFQSREIVATTIKETLEVMRERGLLFELILVNDGSRDGSWEVLQSMTTCEPELTAIDLIKNFGQHSALVCGFAHARGDFIVTMDDDGQNPPAEILKLIPKMNEGYDVVFGEFIRKRHGCCRALGSRAIGCLNAWMFGKPRDVTLTNFRMIRREVITRLLDYNTADPYIPALLLMFAGKIANVPVVHRPRADGRSHYGFVRIAGLVGRILFNYSPLPLRWVCGFGLVVALLCFLYFASLTIAAWAGGGVVPSRVIPLVIVSLFGGIIMLMLGMMGEYLARILNLVSGKKSYVVRTIIRSPTP